MVLLFVKADNQPGIPKSLTFMASKLSKLPREKGEIKQSMATSSTEEPVAENKDTKAP